MLNSPDRPDSTTAGYHGPDRRRWPRSTPTEDITLTVAIAVDAEVLDISAGGALIATPRSLQVGERGRLHVMLGREPFNARVEVKRTQRDAGQASTFEQRMGVSFSAIDDASGRNLHHFVKDDGGSTPNR